MSEKSQYKSLAEWREADLRAYEAARYNNLLDKICDKFGWKRKKPIIWTQELIYKEALKYETIKEWRLKSGSSYIAAHRNKCVAKCTAHMIRLWEKVKKEDVIIDAKKYKNKSEWKNMSKNMYQVALSNKWLEEATSHMNNLVKSKNYWTKEKCLQEALKYKTRSEWISKSTSSSQSARKNGWYEECTKHMVKRK